MTKRQSDRQFVQWSNNITYNILLLSTYCDDEAESDQHCPGIQKKGNILSVGVRKSFVSSVVKAAFKEDHMQSSKAMWTESDIHCEGNQMKSQTVWWEQQQEYAAESDTRHLSKNQIRITSRVRTTNVPVQHQTRSHTFCRGTPRTTKSQIHHLNVQRFLKKITYDLGLGEWREINCEKSTRMRKSEIKRWPQDHLVRSTLYTNHMRLHTACWSGENEYVNVMFWECWKRYIPSFTVQLGSSVTLFKLTKSTRQITMTRNPRPFKFVITQNFNFGVTFLNNLLQYCTNKNWKS